MPEEENLVLVDHIQNALNAACNAGDDALASLLEQALILASSASPAVETGN